MDKIVESKKIVTLWMDMFEGGADIFIQEELVRGLSLEMFKTAFICISLLDTPLQMHLPLSDWRIETFFYHWP